MTRKDYEKIAKAIGESLDINEPKRIWSQDLVSSLCSIFEEDNEKFNEKIFRKAIANIHDTRRGYK
jgi:Fe-S-cluster formation regulator IscX/YfhJ